MRCPKYGAYIDGGCHVFCEDGKTCKKEFSEVVELEGLVEIQGEILAAMSRNNEANPDVLEIQCALSRERGLNLSKLWKLRGEI